MSDIAFINSFRKMMENSLSKDEGRLQQLGCSLEHSIDNLDKSINDAPCSTTEQHWHMLGELAVLRRISSDVFFDFKYGFNNADIDEHINTLLVVKKQLARLSVEVGHVYNTN